VVESYEECNVFMVSMKGKEFTHQMNKYEYLNKDCALRS
jgi:hypothetical protein